MEKIGNHLRVWEYDGAFKCMNCARQWGALPGNPPMPEECVKVERLEDILEKHRIRPEWHRRANSIAARILDYEWHSQADRRSTLVAEIACEIRDAVEAERASRSDIVREE